MSDAFSSHRNMFYVMFRQDKKINEILQDLIKHKRLASANLLLFIISPAVASFLLWQGPGSV